MNKFNIGDKVTFKKENLPSDMEENEVITLTNPPSEEHKYWLGRCEDGSNVMINEHEMQTYIEQDTKEDTPQEDKPKYEVKDKVLYGGDIYEIFNISMDNDKYIYDLKIGEFATISIKEIELTPYIDRVSIGKQAPRELDYEKEYNLLLKEYEDLNEELYIAKTAIKMLSELL